MAAVRRAAVGILAGIGLIGCGSGASKHHPSSAATAPSGQTAAQCHTVRPPAPRGAEHLTPSRARLDPARTYTVAVQTNCGTFAFTLDVKDSPRTAASFYSLVTRGFFDGLTFHRVAAGFVIQGGDPAGNGSGGPGYTVVEPPPRGHQYVLGDVAMAKSAAQPPGASGSQFFVVTAQNATQSAGLTADYALLGRVVSGLAVVERIGMVQTDPPQDGVPIDPVVMSSVTATVR